jgi:hypothetical protein
MLTDKRQFTFTTDLKFDATVNLAFWMCCLNFVPNSFFSLETGLTASNDVIGAFELLQLISIAAVDV